MVLVFHLFVSVKYKGGQIILSPIYNKAILDEDHCCDLASFRMALISFLDNIRMY